MAIFAEISENKFVKEKHPPVISDCDQYCAMSGKRCEIGCKLP